MADPIAYGADWSARPIYGDALSRYRYTDAQGRQHALQVVLRYADFPGQRLSYLTKEEYESHLASDIRTLLIYQRTTRDPDGGEPRGREFGRAAVAYARKIGYRAGEPIFATADAPIGAYDLAVAEAFFRGFADEVRAAGFLAGGYGFRDVVYRLQDRDVVDVLWLCGAESGWRSGIHLYQWNNGRIYPDGVECDLVKQFEPIGDDMGQLTGRQAEMLQQIYDALSKPYQQNGVDVGDVLARLGRLFPDLDSAAMEEFDTLNPGTLTNANVSAYSLLYKVVMPILGALRAQLETLAKAYAEGRQQDADELLDAMRQALGELLNAHVDVAVTLNPRQSDSVPALTGTIQADAERLDQAEDVKP